MRIDKWLWAARFFKTRSLASHACELGRIHSNAQEAKPSREVKVADRLRVKTEAGEFELDVLQLSQIRGPASAAQQLYRETDVSQQRRAELIEVKRALRAVEPEPEHRPSKRDRRQINRLRQRL